MDRTSKNAFQLYHDSYPLFEKLGNTRAGDLILAIFEYETNGNLPNFESDDALDITFEVIKAYLDRNRVKYTQRCEKNRENIQKRWSSHNSQSNTNVSNNIQSNTNEYNCIPNDTNVYETIRIDTKNTDSDKDNDNDNDSDSDKDIDNIKKENIKEKSKKFIKPTIEEIKQYCIDKNININAEQFYNFYESKGWKVGKNPMKNWKACINTWKLNQNLNNQNNKKSYQNYSQRDYNDLDDYYDDL